MKVNNDFVNFSCNNGLKLLTACEWDESVILLLRLVSMLCMFLSPQQAVFTPKNLADSYVPLRAAPAGNFVRDLPKFDDRTANKDHFKYVSQISVTVEIASNDK